MKLKIIILVIGSFLLGENVHSQSQTLIAHYTDRAKQTLDYIQNTDNDNMLKQYYSELIRDYCTYSVYATDLIDTIFDNIWQSRENYTNDYYRFLIANVDCISNKYWDSIRADLDNVLVNSENPRYYHLISIYNLNSRRYEIAKKSDPDFLKDLTIAFRNGRNVQGILKRAVYHSTLASLGDRDIETDVIEAVLTMWQEAKSETSAEKKDDKFRKLYFQIVPELLAPINTINSVKKSILMMDESYKMKESSDVINICLGYQYMLNVLMPKLKREERYKVRDIIYTHGLWNIPHGEISKLIKRVQVNADIWRIDLRLDDH